MRYGYVKLKLDMLQVREKKKGRLRMEEEGYQGKWNEKKEERALGTQNDRKSKNERKEHPLPRPVGRPSLNFHRPLHK